MTDVYYCEVCFAIPLPQCFTYIYEAKSWSEPIEKVAGRGKRKKKQQATEEQCATNQLLLPELGHRIVASFGRSYKEGWIISVGLNPPPSLEQALREGKLSLNQLKPLEIADPKPFFGPVELRLARWIAQYYICSLGESLNCILPTGKKEKEPLLCANCPTVLGATPESLALSQEQSDAVATVCHSGQSLFYYLFGPTGSGKTEVFLQCIAYVLQQGKSVIYLVSEISLCYQLQEQLEQRFKQPVALLHSHLSAQMRLWYWRNLQTGDCRIALGARSAVFAPVRDLGLIVLDEEHEQSYKAGDTPRYHARQVAMRRCRDQQAILLMGSATPSVEAMHAANLPELNCNPTKSLGAQEYPDKGLLFTEKTLPIPDYLPDFIKQGYQIAIDNGSVDDNKQKKKSSRKSNSEIAILHLSQRLAGGCFPKVKIIDLRSSRTMLSSSLVREIEYVTSRGGQAILFLNRRGYSPIVECFTCGKVQECRDCSVALAYHKNLMRLKCHHCGFSMPMIVSCNYCHQSQLEFIGFGTEQIEEELQRNFGHLRIARLDTDVSRKKGLSQKILQNFRQGNLDLLVGTQMVAKGLNFERVELVGVVLADTSLNMPDFRSAERSFSLLVQVAGRAGRYSKDGKVVIQTYQPTSDVIKRAAALDWQNFYAQEIQLRKCTYYPPFSRIIRLVFRGSDTAKVKAEAEQWHRHLQAGISQLLSEKQNNFGEAENSENFAQLLNPCECPYFRVAKKYRYHMLLRCSNPQFQRVHNFVKSYFWQAKRNQSVYVEVDVDPAAMM